MKYCCRKGRRGGRENRKGLGRENRLVGFVTGRERVGEVGESCSRKEERENGARLGSV